MKAKLKGIDVSSREKVVNEVTRMWDEIANDLLEKLARSMPKRIRMVEAKNGGSIKY